MDGDISDLRPYQNQVGGHENEDGLPASLLDEQGRFLKQLQRGPRGDREAAFYLRLNQLATSTLDDATTRHGVAAEPSEAEAAQLLKPWLPKHYGERYVQGHRYLLLEDVCGSYRLPCVLDVKIGYRTWYPWASDNEQQKNKSKDTGTTQARLGFRLCGAHVRPHHGGAAWKVGRQWGQQLTPCGAVAALARFADNGALSVADVFGGEGGALAQLQQLLRVFEVQTAFRFFSASVLITYEGAVLRAAEAGVRVSLVDFAHVYPTGNHDGDGGGCSSCGDDGGGVVDVNFLAGLRSLAGAVQQLLVSARAC